MNTLKKQCFIVENTADEMYVPFSLLRCLSAPTAKLLHVGKRQVLSEKHPCLLNYLPGLFAQRGAQWIKVVKCCNPSR